MRRPALERFEEKVAFDESGCWLWTGNPNRGGYGQFRISPDRISCHAHRAAYELLVEPIPAGMAVDHLCRVRLCVNPDHLEVVTPGENTRRALRAITHCRRGHDEPLHQGKLQRYCRKCRVDHQRRYMERKKAVSGH